MLFNSLEFAIFLPIVFSLYWIIPARYLKTQNLLLLVASYLFYSFWDWRFLGLIVISTLVDFEVGKALYKVKDSTKRKVLLAISLIANLGILGFFKYYNFFIESFIDAFRLFGAEIGYTSVYIILPVGISFYTFQTLSYTIDIYKNKIEPTQNIIAFSAFVGFFPQLVAGPIERASNLLPQFLNQRNFNYAKAVDGLKQLVWGLFKKMVIADNCALFVDQYFGNHDMYSGSSLFIGAFLFTVQIYCDFSGYSDMAIGTARLFGFDLMKNFNFPYFSRSISEFWRRWHISLTSWFKDYIYIPMGGSWGNKSMQVRNTILVFLIIGLWHGAQWKFVIYGLINALHFLPLILLGKNRKYKDSVARGNYFPYPRDLVNILKTLLFLVLVRVFFRAKDVTTAIEYLGEIFSSSFFVIPELINMMDFWILFLFILLFFWVEWMGRTNNYAIESLGKQWKRSYRWGFYYLLILCILYFKAEQQQFIYFQF